MKTSSFPYYSEATSDLSFVPMTRDEEKSLFDRFHNHNDLVARDRLISQHLKLVAKLSLTYAKRSLPDDEAISAGNFGLIQALESRCFKPEMGFRFASYVRAYVRGQVFKAIRERTQGFLSDGNMEGRFSEDAVVTGVKGTADGGNGPCSSAMHVPVHSLSIENSTDMSCDSEAENSQLDEARREAIAKVLPTLKKTERLVIEGFLAGINFSEVARRNNISRQAAQQANVRAWKKLKEALEPLRAELV